MCCHDILCLEQYTKFTCNIALCCSVALIKHSITINILILEIRFGIDAHSPHCQSWFSHHPHITQKTCICHVVLNLISFEIKIPLYIHPN